ncbi:hypothetical protein HYFRA_00002877 [Hymenoscyphus fraxineus]|uniref:Signal peptide-containing protein n=1 Tax=Hymenoscyphus fraxineus TaxID=746836 RepID=A0A9N9KSA4_9HELO|nr:hypothetical protein HYFRA_00002877 [Hymenoscyphus fraxineus]
MSLDVAIQSVVFYVLSCSTCSKISHRRKAKVQAKRERAEKQALETEQPGLYRHPSPFSTNPYWTEEIMMGPGPPKQKKDKGNKTPSQRALNTAGHGSSYAGSTGMSTDAPSSSPTAVDGSRLSGDDWNRKRYQREDEALWGIDFQGSGQKIKHVIAKAGESAGRLLSKSPMREEPYYMSRNPPVNDLHPPVVSSHSSRSETRWMLQPPPSAKIMEGKVRVNRSRAGSDGSTIKNSLSRQMTERTLDSKLQRGETPSRAESRSKTPRSSRPTLQRHESNRSSSPESSEGSSVLKRKHKPPPLSISTPTMNSSMDTLEQVLPTLPEPVKGSEMRERSPRPHLKTIISSSNLGPQVASGDLPLRELSSNSTNSENTIREKPLSPSTVSNSNPKASEVIKSRIDNESTENAPAADQVS